ncbi:MAG TPA: universal stress protein [Solirubrobacter sp.]|nr:universal stress protein [Solirubrobacter sp.]
MSPTVLVACDAASDDDAPDAFAATLARLLDASVARATVHADGRLAGDEPDSLPARPRPGVRVVHAASAPAGLQRLLADERPDLLVVGSSSSAVLGRTLLGDTAERILDGAPGPVVIVPRRYASGPLRAVGAGLLPTSEGAAAARTAAALARAADVPLVALAILRRTPDAQEASALAVLDETIDAVAADLPVERRVLVGEPADALLRASGRLGLLVLGSRAYGPPGVALAGGVTRRVLRGARCPVLIVPRAQ